LLNWPDTRVVAGFVGVVQQYPSGWMSGKNPTDVFAYAYLFGSVHRIEMIDYVALVAVVVLVVSFAFVAPAGILVIAWAVV